MDSISLKRISQAHPSLRVSLLSQYTECNNKILGKGVRLRLAYVYRSPEEQNELFKKVPKVTNSKAWQSVHQYGLAFDIVMLYDLNGDGVFETASYDMLKDFDRDGEADFMEVVKYFQSKGWEWGGSWKSFKDNPHFQKTSGLTWKQMKSKIDSGDFTVENGIKYINL